jgi:hypothetical protein
MQVQDRAAAIEFGEDRVEVGIGERAIQHAGVHRQADHAQFVYGPAHFGYRGVDVRHRRGGERAKTVLPSATSMSR